MTTDETSQPPQTRQSGCPGTGPWVRKPGPQRLVSHPVCSRVYDRPQFVQRMMFLVPDNRASTVVLGNAGWYLMPEWRKDKGAVSYPHSLVDSPVRDRQSLPAVLSESDRLSALSPGAFTVQWRVLDLPVGEQCQVWVASGMRQRGGVFVRAEAVWQAVAA